MDSAKPASPTEVLKQLLKDPNFTESLRQELIEKARARTEKHESFKKSDLFQQMLRTFTENTSQTSLSTDDIGEYFEETKTRLGWELLADDDVKLFLAALSDSSSPDVEPGTYTKDAECPFPNCSFKTFGLTVRILSGQGTFVSISNR